LNEKARVHRAARRRGSRVAAPGSGAADAGDWIFEFSAAPRSFACGNGMDRLDAMKVFVVAVDEQSLAAAGRKLGRSPAAVSRAIAFLEERVGRRRGRSS